MACTLVACDDDTALVGTDIMPDGDKMTAMAKIFPMSTTTWQTDSVLANTGECYLGCIVDPEMHVRTTCDFLAQFHLPQNFRLPSQDMIFKDPVTGKPEADSCDIYLYFKEYYGDSLATMKLRVMELDKERVMEEGVKYYTDIDPADYVSTAPSAVNLAQTYSISDLAREQNAINSSSGYYSVQVRLPKNYAQKMMDLYYENPEYFANSYAFIHHVCPGFYFKCDGGVGSVLSAEMMGLNLYFRYHTKTEAGNDTVVDGMQRMGATEEVLQNTRIVDDYPDAMTLDEVQQQNCTYMKTPLGLYTEMTLPVADIVAGEHYRDSINQVQLSLRRYVPTSGSKDVFPCPQNVLLLRKADMFTFFEKDKLPDSKTSYLTQYNASTNVYQFANIATLVATLKKERDEGAGVMPTDSEEERNRKYAAWETENAEWNKVVLVPVRADYTNSTNIYGISTQTLLRVRNMLGLTSVKLEGGADTPIQVQVVYSRIARK